VERMGYPWRASIESMLGFSDEVVALDGGSDDGSYGMLLEWAAKEPKLKVHQLVRDSNDSNLNLLDTQHKAEARRLCSGDFCWQMDIDEVVHERDWDKIRATVHEFPRVVDLIAIPAIELMDDKGRVRIESDYWKCRLSRNSMHITHGILDKNQDSDSTKQSIFNLYKGSDYISSQNSSYIPFGTFVSEEVEQARQAAMAGNQEAIVAYEQWLNMLVERAPIVYKRDYLKSNSVDNYSDSAQVLINKDLPNIW